MQRSTMKRGTRGHNKFELARSDTFKYREKSRQASKSQLHQQTAACTDPETSCGNEDDEEGIALFGDFVLHRDDDTKHIIHRVELVDDDGVPQFGTRFELVGAVAQQASVVLENPHMIGLLTPRTASTIASDHLRFDDETRDFRLIASDRELDVLIRRWGSKVHYDRRTNERRLRAVAHIAEQLKLHEVADRTNALHGLWELALQRENHLVIQGSVIEQVLHVIRSTHLLGDAALNACSAVWALSQVKRSRAYLVSRGAVEALLLGLNRQNKLAYRNPPQSHRHALSALRSLMADHTVPGRFIKGTAAAKHQSMGVTAARTRTRTPTTPTRDTQTTKESNTPTSPNSANQIAEEEVEIIDDKKQIHGHHISSLNFDSFTFLASTLKQASYLGVRRDIAAILTRFFLLDDAVCSFFFGRYLNSLFEAGASDSLAKNLAEALRPHQVQQIESKKMTAGSPHGGFRASRKKKAMVSALPDIPNIEVKTLIEETELDVDGNDDITYNSNDVNGLKKRETVGGARTNIDDHMVGDTIDASATNKLEIQPEMSFANQSISSSKPVESNHAQNPSGKQTPSHIPRKSPTTSQHKNKNQDQIVSKQLDLGVSLCVTEVLSHLACRARDEKHLSVFMTDKLSMSGDVCNLVAHMLSAIGESHTNEVENMQKVHDELKASAVAIRQNRSSQCLLNEDESLTTALTAKKIRRPRRRHSTHITMSEAHNGFDDSDSGEDSFNENDKSGDENEEISTTQTETSHRNPLLDIISSNDATRSKDPMLAAAAFAAAASLSDDEPDAPPNSSFNSQTTLSTSGKISRIPIKPGQKFVGNPNTVFCVRQSAMLPGVHKIDVGIPLVFNSAEWKITKGRAVEMALLHSAGIMWGIAQAVSKQNDRQWVTSDNSNTGGPRRGSFGARSSKFEAAKVEATRKLIANLTALAIASRVKCDPRPAVELCCISALDAFAHSNSESLRAFMLHPVVSEVKPDGTLVTGGRCGSDFLGLSDTQENMSDVESLSTPKREQKNGRVLQDVPCWDTFRYPSEIEQQKHDSFQINIMNSRINELSGGNTGTRNMGFAASLVEVCVASTDQGRPTDSRVSEVYSLSLLVGLLDTCVAQRVSASMCFPQLNLDQLMNITAVDWQTRQTRKNSDTQINTDMFHSSHGNRLLACACVMLHAFLPTFFAPVVLDGLVALSEIAKVNGTFKYEALSPGNEKIKSIEQTAWGVKRIAGLVAAIQGKDADSLKEEELEEKEEEEHVQPQNIENPTPKPESQSNSDTQGNNKCGNGRKTGSPGSKCFQDNDDDHEDETENEQDKERKEVECKNIPTGNALGFLSLGVWGLARCPELRTNLCKAGCITALTSAVQKTLSFIEAYASAAKQEHASLRRHMTRSAIATNAKASNIETFLLASTPSNAIKARDYFVSLDAVLSALWILVCDPRDIPISAQDPDLNHSCEQNATNTKLPVWHKNAKELIHTVAQILMGVNSSGPWAKKKVKKKDSDVENKQEKKLRDTSSLWHVHGDLTNEIGRKCVLIMWILSATHTCDSHLATKSALRSVLFTVYNPTLSAKTRIEAASYLLYIEKHLGQHDDEPPTSRALVKYLGPSCIPQIVLSFLGSECEELRECGARMIVKVGVNKLGTALLKHKKGNMLLLNMAKTGSSPQVIHAALQALLFVSNNRNMHEALVCDGLYSLLELSWTCEHHKDRVVVACILANLASNPKTKTEFYKAELRCRYMLGWKDIQEPSTTAGANAQEKSQLKRTGSKNQKSSPTSKKKQRTPVTPRKFTARKITNIHDADKHGSLMQRRLSLSGAPEDSPKGRYVSWLENTFEQQDGDCNESVMGRGQHIPTPPKSSSPKKRKPSIKTRRKIKPVNLRRKDIPELLETTPKVSEGYTDDTAQNNEDYTGTTNNNSFPSRRLAKSLSGFLRNRREDHSQGSNNNNNNNNNNFPDPSLSSSRRPLGAAEFARIRQNRPANGDAVPTRTPYETNSPHRSPLWHLRSLILNAQHWSKDINEGTETNSKSDHLANVSPAAQGVGKMIAPETELFGQTHNAQTVFTEGDYRRANFDLMRRMRKPIRALWTPDMSTGGKKRWSPRVKSISSYSNTGNVKEDEKNENCHTESAPASDTIEVNSTTNSGPDFTSQTAPKRQYISKKEKVIVVRLETDEHHSAGFVFQRNKRRAKTNWDERNPSPRLAKFDHVKGAKVLDGQVPTYEQPDGSEVYMYLENAPLFGLEDAIDDHDVVPTTPMFFEHLGIDRLPVTPKATYQHGWLANVLGQRALPICPTQAAVPETYSLEPTDGKQPKTGVRWTRRGVVVDEPMPFKTTLLSEEDVPEVEEEDVGEPWSLEKSVWLPRSRGIEGGSLWNDQAATAAAFDNDWKICEQKRTFLKLLSKSAPVLDQIQQILRVNYGKLCDIHRFYSASDGSQNLFTMQLNEFADFINDTNIRDEDALVTEGYCDTLFVQVNFNPIEKLTDAQKRFQTECSVMSLSRGHALMRYQLLEVVTRLAQAKYLQPGLATDIADALRLLFENNIDKNLGGEVILNTDNFRRDRLYNQGVDEALKKSLFFLKMLFKEFSGSMTESHRYGGRRHKRLNIVEWQQMLDSVGMYNAFFTYRESNIIFKLSIMDVVDEIANWRNSVALTFVNFLEAICRTADVMVIPTDEQLGMVGADDIVEFYRIMESTGLWDTVLSMDIGNRREMTELRVWQKRRLAAQYRIRRNSPTHLGIKNTKRNSLLKGGATLQPGGGVGVSGARRKSLPFAYDSRPLSEKLASLLQIMQHVKARQSRLDREAKLWLGSSSKDRGSVLNSSATAQVAAAQKKGDTLYYDSKTGEPKRMGDQADDGKKISSHKFEASVAATLHDVWRENRGMTSDGTKYAERLKMIDGVEYDIANLHFAKLPGHFQMENLLAAHAACESIRFEFEEHEQRGLGADALAMAMQSEEFMERASEFQHIQWLKRNGKKEWVEDHQRVVYEELSEEEKQKDRDIVVTAVKVWLANRGRLK